ncbi:MAG: efflux RND transporter permease subunit, partial [Leptospiraceae bacterium]|nr:efflux RND transporter permease subunit [Leptospiraceae bacterium]
MKSLVKFFLERPILVNIIVLIVFGYSLISISRMKKEAFPELALGRFVITTIYPGASAGDVELNVTLPIEEALKEVEGIQELKSYSRESISIVDITADENFESVELQRMYMDIDSALSSIKNLPSGIDNKPLLEEISSSDLPVLEITFSGEYKDLINFLPKVEDEIAGLEGVSSVTRIGMGDEEVHILVDPEEAKKNYVDLLMIANAIKKRNILGSGGTLQSFTDEKKIVSYEKFQMPEEVLETNIFMSQDGFGVRLKDVATLEYKPKNTKMIVRNNGKRGASLLIKKKPTADILKTIDGISDYLSTLKTPERVSFKKLNDGSKLTRDRIQLVMGNAIVGFILVFICLFFVFDIKTAIWTGFGIPFTLLTCLVILYSKGLTLNMFVLGGFILVIGMLVDDAIVIAEKINSNLEAGLSPIEAASSAVADVWKPVVASSATTMIAFSPLVSLGGLPGKFIWMIPLVVILSLIVSLIESFFLLP